MRIKCKVYIHSIITVIFIGCNTPLTIIDNAVSLSYHSDLHQVLIDTVCFTSSKFVALETNDNALLRNVSRIYIDDDKLFVFDKGLKQLVIFDTNGKYIAHIHSVGNGPFEYIGVMDFCLDTDKKQILLLCDSPFKIIRYDYSGNVIVENKINNLYQNIVYTDNGFICNNTETMYLKNAEFELLEFDNVANITEKYLSVRPGITSNSFNRGNGLTHSHNVLYTRRFDYSIYAINKEGITRKYAIDFGKNSIPNILKIGEFNNDIAKVAREKNQVYSITEAVENDTYLMFYTNAAIFFYDKQKKDLTAHELVYCSKLKISSNSFYSIGGNSRYNVGLLVDSYRLLSIKNYINEQQTEIDKQLFDFLDSVKEDDNPILILYEFKN